MTVIILYRIGKCFSFLSYYVVAVIRPIHVTVEKRENVIWNTGLFLTGIQIIKKYKSCNKRKSNLHIKYQTFRLKNTFITTHKSFDSYHQFIGYYLHNTQFSFNTRHYYLIKKLIWEVFSVTFNISFGHK